MKVFKGKTAVITGAASFPFSAVPGGTIDYGCAAPWSVAKGGNSLFWLSKSRRGGVVVVEGNLSGQVRPVSDRQLEREFGAFAVVADAHGFIYDLDGHTFYQLTFPTEGKTYCYDASTGFWADRTSPGLTRDRAVGHVFFAGRHLVGDFASGAIYEIDRQNHDRSWRRRFQVLHDQGRMLFYRRLELNYERGTANAAGGGSDPVVWLRQSNDGGRTFGNESYRNTGAIGEYRARAVWSGPSLSAARDKTFEIGSNEPVETVILGAYVDVERGT